MSLLIALILLLPCCSRLSYAWSLSYPDIGYDILEADIWQCPNSYEKRIKYIEDNLHGHILTRNRSTISVITSSDLSQQFAGACVSQGRANIHNYNEVTDEENDHHSISRRSTDVDLQWFESYHNFSSIKAWFEELSDTHPQLVDFISIGRTAHGREIFAIKLTNKEVVKPKPKVYLQCLLHAREWITGPMCMYIAYRLVNEDTTPHNSLNVHSILSASEIIIVPIANPDGYELTWSEYPKYRLWRKNLSSSSTTSSCIGVDLNRNFNIDWGNHGSSTDQCSDTYQGPSPVSEEETKAITQFLKQQTPLIGSVDFHSYSQVILYPSGWTTVPIDNIRQIRKIARKVADSASQRGMPYTSQQMGSIYLASGTFGDWINSDEMKENNKNTEGITHQPVSLTIELSPQDNQPNNIVGFMVKPDQILPICENMFDAVVTYVSLLLTDDNYNNT